MNYINRGQSYCIGIFAANKLKGFESSNQILQVCENALITRKVIPQDVLTIEREYKRACDFVNENKLFEKAKSNSILFYKFATACNFLNSDSKFKNIKIDLSDAEIAQDGSLCVPANELIFEGKTWDLFHFNIIETCKGFEVDTIELSNQAGNNTYLV